MLSPISLLYVQSGTKTSRSRSAKRAGSESSQESHSLPPPSPMSCPDPLLAPGLDPMMSFQGLSSPSDSTMLMSGSQDPMLSMPSPGPGSELGLLPTVLGSPGPLLVSYRLSHTSLSHSSQRVSCVACDTLCCVSAYCHLQTNLTCSLLDTNTSTRIYRHPGSLKMINFVVDNVYGFSFFMWFSYSHSH